VYLKPTTSHLLAAVMFIQAALVGACGAKEEDAPAEPTVQVLVGTPAPQESPAPSDAAELEVVARSPAEVSLSWLQQQVEVPPLPAVAAPREDAGLLSAVRAALVDAPGRSSVVVHNLADGRYAAVEPEEVYYAASTFKLGILYEAFRQRDAGILDFNRLLTLEEKYVADDLGTLELLGLHAGDTLTVADAVRAMIIVSDTPTAALLQDTVGGQTADATLRSLGIEDTSFNNRMLPATAADLAALLTAIAGGIGVSAESRAEMMALLLQESYKDGVAAGVPEGTAVAHKTGSFSDATHDISLVWGPAGPYVIAVMTDQPNNWAVVAQVSRAVWDFFAANP